MVDDAQMGRRPRGRRTAGGGPGLFEFRILLWQVVAACLPFTGSATVYRHVFGLSWPVAVPLGIATGGAFYVAVIFGLRRLRRPTKGSVSAPASLRE